MSRPGRAAIVGRERELEAADRFLDVAVERFAVLELLGDPGIGKTTVWREVADRAERRGCVVLSCRPAEAETKLALSGVADLLGPVPQTLFDRLPDPQRRALDVALLRSELDGASPELRTLGAAVRSLLIELSEERPVVVAIDDAQWLDSTSALVVRFVLRRLVDARVGWLFAARPGGSPTVDVDRVVGLEHVTRLELGPLGVGALHRVVEGQLEHPLTRPMLLRTHRISGGNPLFAIEVARALSRVPASDAPFAPVPSDLGQLLAERLRPLPAETREALLMASTLSDPTTTVVDEEALHPAEHAELVHVSEDGRVRFRHPLYASAVYDAASRADRRRVHERLASLVDDPEQRAGHLAAATSGPDEGVARLVEEAAERARSRGAWESSAELLERARTLTPPEMTADARRRTIAAAEHYVHAGDRRRARTLLEEVLAESPPRSVRAHALRVLAEVCFHDENLVEATRLYEQALECADEPHEAAVIGMCLAFTASNLHQLDVGRPYAHRALELAEGTGDSGLIAHALAIIVMYGYLTGDGVDWAGLRRSLALDDTTLLMPLQLRPKLIDAFLRGYVGEHQGAREGLTQLRAWAVDQGDESDVAFVLIFLSWLETRCGDLTSAAAHAEEAVALARLTGSGSLEAWARMQRTYVRAHRGEVDETRRECAAGVDLGQQYGLAQLDLWVAASRALLELSVGNPQGVWDACEPRVSMLEERGIGEPVELFYLPDSIEALIALGSLDRAEALVDMLESSARNLDRTWALATGARCRALLLAARGDLDGALAAADAAGAAHQRIELPFDLARTLLVKGVVERRLRQRAKAKASFEEALGLFDRLGTPLWAAHARAEIERLGLRRTPSGELTHAEQRVAELTAQGRTGREVAAALQISPKTVEATLGRVYRKLGIRSRAELGARMAKGVDE